MGGKIMDKIQIYCDGACRGNQHENNIGAYGIVLEYKGMTREFDGVGHNTTNNIMELTAIITALKLLKKKDIPIEVYSDSQYVTDGINSWIKKWRKNNWMTSTKTPIANRELWQELLALKESFTDITIIKVKGHASNAGNNRADELCNIAMNEYIATSQEAL